MTAFVFGCPSFGNALDYRWPLRDEYDSSDWQGILVARLDTQVFFGYSSFLTPLPRANIGANDIYL